MGFDLGECPPHGCWEQLTQLGGVVCHGAAGPQVRAELCSVPQVQQLMHSSLSLTCSHVLTKPSQGRRRRPGRPRITKGPRLSSSPVHASRCSCGHNIEDSLKAFFGRLSCWDKGQDRPKAPGASIAGQGQSTVSISTLAPGPDSEARCLSAGPRLHCRSWLQDPQSRLFLPPQGSLGSGLAGVADAAETQDCREGAVHAVPWPPSHREPPGPHPSGVLTVGLGTQHPGDREASSPSPCSPKAGQ